MGKRFITIILSLTVCLVSSGQEKVGTNWEIDKTVHNFGDIIHESGAVSCTFTMKNIGTKPAVIYNIVTSCGCTDVNWTREPVKPGATARISAKYSNDQGALPFDKSLTVYLSDMKKPLILRLRGNCIEKAIPIKESYPIHFGPLGFKSGDIKCGNMEQGGQTVEYHLIANISSKPIKVSFESIDPELKITVTPSVIPANSTAEMKTIITGSRKKWGKNYYYAVPVVNGQKQIGNNGKKKIGFWAFTKENFSSWTKEQRATAAKPSINKGTWAFNKIKQGESINAEFNITNHGKEDLTIYKVDVNKGKYSIDGKSTIKNGETSALRINVDSSSLPKGEVLIIATLTTNSPTHPLINLYIAGIVE